MKYTTPETQVLKVNGQDLLVSFGETNASSPAPAPARSGELGTMTVKTITSW